MLRIRLTDLLGTLKTPTKRYIANGNTHFSAGTPYAQEMNMIHRRRGNNNKFVK